MGMEQKPDYTLAAFIEGLQILSKYMDNGLQTKFALCAEHDIIYVRTGLRAVSPEEAEKLESLKFQKDDSGWLYFT